VLSILSFVKKHAVGLVIKLRVGS